MMGFPLDDSFYRPHPRPAVTDPETTAPEDPPTTP